LRSLDIDFRTAVKFMKDFLAAGGEDEPLAFTAVVLAGDADAVPDGVRPGPNGKRLRRARKAGMPLAGVVVVVDGGVEGEAADVEPAGVGTWPFGEEEGEDFLLLGEEVGLPAEA
jgi:hypothetical protein